MSKNSFFKNYFALIPLVFSGLLCIALIFFLFQKIALTPAFSVTIIDQIPMFIAISGCTAFCILAYMVFSVFSLRRLASSSDSKLEDLTQKMNSVRQIIEIILDSKLWLPGVKDFIDDEFEGLTFFEVKEFYKGKSKLAIEFLQEKKEYDETETLYLELKSLLYTEAKQKKLPKAIYYPEQYKTEIIEKWIEHKVGSGLWYYFGYKFGDFKEALDVEGVFERHQDKIMKIANNINNELFEDSSFNEVFFSKLGEYINKDLLPKLYNAQSRVQKGLPKALQFLYFFFASLLGIGVILPLISSIFELPILALIFSFSFVISSLFFLILTTLPLLSKTTNS